MRRKRSSADSLVRWQPRENRSELRVRLLSSSRSSIGEPRQPPKSLLSPFLTKSYGAKSICFASCLRNRPSKLDCASLLRAPKCNLIYREIHSAATLKMKGVLSDHAH